MSLAKTSPDWFIVTLEVTPEAAAALVDLIQERWPVQVLELERPGAPRGWVEVYFPSEVEALLAARVLAGDNRVITHAVRGCRERDWSSFWKHHFHPQEVGRRLLILPAWDRDRKRERSGARIPIILNPGLSFGTGDHFTTRFCLEMIERLCGAGGALLDVGTGSGILSIAAAKLGCTDVVGVDHDAVSVRRARENSALNGVDVHIRFLEQDILRGHGDARYDVVCANLFSSLLLEAAPLLTRLARRDLILSGIREEELDGVADCYMRLGARETVRDGDGEWGGLVFTLKNR